MRRPAIFLDGDNEENEYYGNMEEEEQEGSSMMGGSDNSGGLISLSSLSNRPYDDATDRNSRSKKKSKYAEQDMFVATSDTMTNIEKVRNGIFIQRPFVKKDSFEAFKNSLLRNVYKNLLFLAYYDPKLYSSVTVDKSEDIFGDWDNDIFSYDEEMANQEAMLIELSRLFLVHYEWTLISIKRNNIPLYSQRFQYLNEPIYVSFSPFEGDIKAKLANSGNKGPLFQIYRYLYAQLTRRKGKMFNIKKYQFMDFVDKTFNSHFYKTIFVLGKIFQHSAESFAKSALEVIKPTESSRLRYAKIRNLQREGKKIPDKLEQWMKKNPQERAIDRPPTIKDIPVELLYEIVTYARPKYISVLEYMDLIHISTDISEFTPNNECFRLVLEERNFYTTDALNEKRLFFVFNRGKYAKVPIKRKTGIYYADDPKSPLPKIASIDISPLLDIYSFLVALIYVIKLYMLDPDSISYHPTSAFPYGDKNETVRLVDTSWYPRVMSEINHESLMKIGELFVDHSEMLVNPKDQPFYVPKRQII